MSERLPSSFRDPSGFLFRRDGILLRQVNEVYREAYDQLMGSGLYDALVNAGLLVPHEEVSVDAAAKPGAYKVLRPQGIPFVSYPFEWCFSQLKRAALATLGVQQVALEHEMSLKDASAYNIQFIGSRPVLIDTLSFEPYEEGKPWVAYRQFCQHFVAPLALMAWREVRLGQLLRIHLDGIPLDLAARLLPSRTWLRSGLALHVHLHAASQRRLAREKPGPSAARRRMSRTAFLGLVESLRATISAMRWQPAGTPWADYQDMSHYSAEAAERKKALVAHYLGQVQPQVVWDLGANVGAYSRIASGQGIPTIAFDNDLAAVERSYVQACREGDVHLLPLVMDLTNPTPSVGWALRERDSLLQRGPADLLMALALIHHLVISNNVPMDHLASFLAQVGRWLIIEFVPKDDPQVQKLLAWRKDIFGDYSQSAFEQAFRRHYAIRTVSSLPGSDRCLYLMERISST